MKINKKSGAKILQNSRTNQQTELESLLTNLN